jgi:hypothetical protein
MNNKNLRQQSNYNHQEKLGKTYFDNLSKFIDNSNKLDNF